MSDTETATGAAEPSAEAWDALAEATSAAMERAEQAGEAEVTDNESATDDEPNPNAREARYRVQLRETEAERDQLRANVEALQRAEVERIAGQTIQKPAALWSADVNLSDLLDESGTVDRAKVDAAVKSAQETLGLAQKRPGGYVGSEGRTIDSKPASDPWGDAFKG